MAETTSKKDIFKKKLLKRKSKEEKKMLKKQVNNKGKSLEEMFVYVDINGHLTDVPPHLQDRSENNAKPFLGGTVTHLNDKGFGFIKEDNSNENVFFHNSSTSMQIEINDRVLFTKMRTERGFKAQQVKKEN